ncbi:hypothetical protein PIB30_044102 [Stylosanthes scabra]|uniref:Uncharacterized protein n=1 Tax=Stylosanthes scabra TaxID=79078 RepID=A0ABU6ZEG5_9FABA|nr:hypothetical protein [Stylosanthes scabra]
MNGAASDDNGSSSQLHSCQIRELGLRVHLQGTLMLKSARISGRFVESENWSIVGRFPYHVEELPLMVLTAPHKLSGQSTLRRVEVKLCHEPSSELDEAYKSGYA